jgi:hypothetical protein
LARTIFCGSRAQRVGVPGHARDEGSFQSHSQQCGLSRPGAHARPEAEGGDAGIRQNLGQGIGIRQPFQHDGVQVGGVFDQRRRGAADRHQPCSDPQAAPGGEAGSATVAHAAGKDEGVAVGEFIPVARLFQHFTRPPRITPAQSCKANQIVRIVSAFWQTQFLYDQFATVFMTFMQEMPSARILKGHGQTCLKNFVVAKLPAR